MNIAWLYEKSLYRDIGGTERATMLNIDMLNKLGHSNFAYIIINREKDSVSFEDKPIEDLYSFLKKNKIDIVINQIGYSCYLLKRFKELGGDKWQQEGGKIITYMHFDPKMNSDLDFFLSIENKTLRNYITILKLYILKPYYTRKENKKYQDIYKYLYENSDYYVTLSHTHFPYLISLLGTDYGNKLYAINNTLTFDNISNTEILKEKEKSVIIVARMSEIHKRILTAIKAWKEIQKDPQYNEWTFKIIGNGPDLERYKKYVSKNNIKRISFEGEQDPEPYYTKASLFLMTSPAEGWGLTLTESLQRGVVPIVMNSSPVFSEIIEDNVCGILVENNNIKQFIKSIKHLMDNEEKRIEFAKKCLDRAKLFCRENTQDKWNILINKIKPSNSNRL